MREIFPLPCPFPLMYLLSFRKEWSAKMSTPLKLWVSSCKMGVPTDSHCHGTRYGLAGLIRSFLTDKQKLNGLGIHLIWSFWTYILNRQALNSSNSNVVYATHISKITNFSERLKNYTLRKYNFENSFNVKQMTTNVHKLLRETTCTWKMKKYSARFCFACIQIRWWIAERTFLTSFICNR